MTLPTYVINLDRRSDRWRSISRNLGAVGLVANHISAIDALTLARKNEGGNGNKPTRVISVGDEACTLSHCKALNEFLHSPHPIALILEDDAEVSRDVPGCLQSIEWWPTTSGLLKIEISPVGKVCLMGNSVGQTPCGRNLHPILLRNGGTAGYLINRETAQIVLNACAKMTMPIDQLLFNVIDSPLAQLLRPLQVVPAMVRQKREVFASDITHSRDKIQEGWRNNRKRWNRNLYKARLQGARLLGHARRIQVHYSDTNDRR